MDFSSLGENSIVHILRKKPFEYLTGKLKSKSSKQQNPFIPQTTPQPIDIVVSVNNSDEVVPGIQQGMETVEYRGCYYSTSSDGIQQALVAMMQIADNGISEQPYYQSVKEKGEGYLEMLNPQYAEGKRQARTIKTLQERVDKQDSKLDEILSFVKDLASPSKK